MRRRAGEACLSHEAASSGLVQPAYARLSSFGGDARRGTNHPCRPWPGPVKVATTHLAAERSFTRGRHSISPVLLGSTNIATPMTLPATCPQGTYLPHTYVVLFLRRVGEFPTMLHCVVEHQRKCMQLRDPLGVHHSVRSRRCLALLKWHSPVAVYQLEPLQDT